MMTYDTNTTTQFKNSFRCSSKLWVDVIKCSRLELNDQWRSMGRENEPGGYRGTINHHLDQAWAAILEHLVQLRFSLLMGLAPWN